MANRRKAEISGMQDPLYPRDPNHVRRLSIIDPDMAIYLPATKETSHDDQPTAPVTATTEWQPESPDVAFVALGLGQEVVARQTDLH